MVVTTFGSRGRYDSCGETTSIGKRYVRTIDPAPSSKKKNITQRSGSLCWLKFRSLTDILLFLCVFCLGFGSLLFLFPTPRFSFGWKGLKNIYMKRGAMKAFWMISFLLVSWMIRPLQAFVVPQTSSSSSLWSVKTRTIGGSKFRLLTGRPQDRKYHVQSPSQQRIRQGSIAQQQWSLRLLVVEEDPIRVGKRHRLARDM